ncbi:MAG: hypothetical protein PHG19_03705 [Anaerotignum sp.]|nr:hypothetical protein [Anaerotignum sp.]
MEVLVVQMGNIKEKVEDTNDAQKRLETDLKEGQKSLSENVENKVAALSFKVDEKIGALSQKVIEVETKPAKDTAATVAKVKIAILTAVASMIATSIAGYLLSGFVK